ncbi:hypothetical protein [Mycobacterium sp. MMS18-G62]
MKYELQSIFMAAVGASVGVAIALTPAIAFAEPTDSDSSAAPGPQQDNAPTDNAGSDAATAANAGPADAPDSKVGSEPDSKVGSEPDAKADAESEERAWQETEAETSGEAAKVAQLESDALATKEAAAISERAQDGGAGAQQELVDADLATEKAALVASRNLAAETLEWQKTVAAEEAAALAALRTGTAEKVREDMSTLVLKSKTTNEELIAKQSEQISTITKLADSTKWSSIGSALSGLTSSQSDMIAASEEAAAEMERARQEAFTKSPEGQLEFMQQFEGMMHDLRATIQTIADTQTASMETIWRAIA